MQNDLAQRPVIVGIGEVIDRPDDLRLAKEPLTLMCEALRAADDDAHGLLKDADSLDVVRLVSAAYTDLPRQVSERLGLTCRRAVVTEGSGNGPLREIYNAALQIASGACQVAAICGAEAQYSATQAARQKIQLDWIPNGPNTNLFKHQYDIHPMAAKYGLVVPLQVYPLYENAATAAWGQSPAEARAETAAIWSSMSAIAAKNPHAWGQRTLTPGEIAQPGAANRLVAWPYLKDMVAQPAVNLGAALLMTSYQRARRAGIPHEQLIFVEAGAAAQAPEDYLRRDRYDSNAAQTAVLMKIQELLGHSGSHFDAIDLYSCFPIVPKMARRLMKLPVEHPLTVAGGLTFFGGPLHNYMSHAAAAVVRRLRQKSGKGLLYGQGGYVTKHHAIIVSSGEPPAAPLASDYSVQHAAQALQGPVPQIVEDYAGPATIETFTIIYDRKGEPDYGAVVARTPDGRRTVARVPGNDHDTIAALTVMDRSVIGDAGKIEAGHDGLNRWTTV